MRDGEGAYAPLSSAFKDGRRFFFVVTLSAIFIRSLFIGFAQVRPPLSPLISL